MNARFALSILAGAVLSAAAATTAAAGSLLVDGAEADKLSDAFTSVQDGGTITLLGDVAGGVGAKTPGSGEAGKSFTLDLGGFTYSFHDAAVGSTGTETNGLQLLKGNAVTIRNGRLNLSAEANKKKFNIMVQNYSDLTLDNVVVDASGMSDGAYAISNNCGSVKIRRSTVIAAKNGHAFDLYFWPKNSYTDGVEVTVEDSTIGGRMELTTDGTSNIGKRHNLTITGGTLTANSFTGSGGKIGNQGYLKVSGTALSGNSATGNGGAVYNEGSATKAGSAEFTNVTFDGNTSKNGNGGAVWNKGGTVTVTDGVFTGNSAAKEGGAIWNSGTLTLAGTNYFEGNVAGESLNDIANSGTLSVSGSLTLNGGIVNTGTVSFAEGTTVTAILTDEAISSGKYALVSGGTIEGLDNVKLVNGVYNVAWNGTTGEITVEAKSTEEIAGSLNVSETEAGAVSAFLPVATGGTAASAGAAQIAGELAAAAQAGDGAKAAAIAEAVAPSTAPVVESVTRSVTGAINGVARTRMALVGRSAGDALTGGSAWAQTIYNRSEQDATAEASKFEADTWGITVGADGRIGDRLTVGLGFGYTQTDADADSRDVDVDGYTLFGYGEYGVGRWFVNGTLSATLGRYEEIRRPAGVKLTAEYDVAAFGAAATAGYRLDCGLTPEFGLRYAFTHREGYEDGVQKVGADNTDLLTAVIGAKFEQSFEAADWTLRPNVRLAASYDVLADDAESTVRVLGGGAYRVVAEHQERAALEAGAGLEAVAGDWTLSVSWSGEFREHFDAHTAALQAKYAF